MPPETNPETNSSNADDSTSTINDTYFILLSICITIWVIVVDREIGLSALESSCSLYVVYMSTINTFKSEFLKLKSKSTNLYVQSRKYKSEYYTGNKKCIDGFFVLYLLPGLA